MKEHQRKSNKEAVALEKVIQKVLLNLGRESNVEMTNIWPQWRQLVGDAVADNTHPAAFKGDVLLVHVSSSTWAHHLQYLKKDLVRKINTAMGSDLVSDIIFKIGDI